MTIDIAKLRLERRDQINRTSFFGGEAIAAVAPPVDETYWSYRVMLSGTQAVLGFPKYSTVGIGFALEEDWNANLPYRTCSAQQIFEHIRHNKGDDAIPDETVIAAIQMIREAAAEDRGTELEA